MRFVLLYNGIAAETTSKVSANGLCVNAMLVVASLWRINMSSIPVNLPQDLREFVETKVKSGQFANAGEYIVALVDIARRKKSDIEAALIEGLESSPAEPWTSQEWQDIKQRVVDRHQQG